MRSRNWLKRGLLMLLVGLGTAVAVVACTDSPSETDLVRPDALERQDYWYCTSFTYDGKTTGRCDWEDDPVEPPPENTMCDPYMDPMCEDDYCAQFPESCGGGTEILPTAEETEAAGICDSAAENCLKELTNGEKDTLKKSIRNELRTSDDPVLCEGYASRLNELIDAGRVYRGATGSDTHDAEYDPNTGKMHIDNDIWVDLRNALREYPQTDASRQRAEDARERLLALALHETAHERGSLHPGEDGSQPYQKYPFNLFDSRTSGAKCVQF